MSDPSRGVRTAVRASRMDGFPQREASWESEPSVTLCMSSFRRRKRKEKKRKKEGTEGKKEREKRIKEGKKKEKKRKKKERKKDYSG